MATFHDAGGAVFQASKKAVFRNCVSHKKQKNFDALVTIEDARLCERPAILMKKHLTLERQMTEKKRKEVEAENIEKAVRDAKKQAKKYLATDAGMIMIRALAKEKTLQNEFDDPVCGLINETKQNDIPQNSTLFKENPTDETLRGTQNTAISIKPTFLS